MLVDRRISHKLASSRPVVAAGQSLMQHGGLCTIRRAVSCSSSGAQEAPAAAATQVLVEAVPFEAGDAPKQYAAVVTGCAPCMVGATQVNIDESKVVTKFIAETLLPTRHGKFRLRGYKHSVRILPYASEFGNLIIFILLLGLRLLTCHTMLAGCRLMGQQHFRSPQR
jgi:hypothetical protein